MDGWMGGWRLIFVKFKDRSEPINNMIICSAIVFVYCSNANGLVSYRRPRKKVSKGVMRTKMSLIKETTSSAQLKIGFGKVFVER